MMMILGAVALLVLTAAVVLLFAMVGELSSRVPEAREEQHVTPYSDFTAGATAQEWPAGLAHLADRPAATVLVLSSICTTCANVAQELSSYTRQTLGDVGIVVSCAAAPVGVDFVEHYGLDHLPHHVDEGGSWMATNFGVKMSPTALRFQRGVLVEAYTFSKVQPLLGQISKVLEGVS
ncbi:hypothetical protein [Fodinicola acaciae]|uniref:hypothetical protein n=1 Tax=Fodinicola acaciae TaxID=2681555 RepID=UPI0013D23981|nr:hypothetical protein [Fodinicola acaciae]